MPTATAMQQCLSENLYLAAYVLTQGGAHLKRIHLTRSGGRTTAVFELEGPWVQRHFEECLQSQAIVNLSEYLQALEGLKDQLFAVLKKDETRRSPRR